MTLCIKICTYFLSQEKLEQTFPSQFFFKGQLLEVVRAPEPSDINWQNMGVSDWTLFKLNGITNLATLFILGLCFGLILAIYQL